MDTKAARLPSPMAWVPSLYIAMGMPYALVIWVAGTFFKDLGHTDGQITLATASIGIAWSLKPFWASFLDMYRTKKFWVVGMEMLLGVLLCLVAVALPLPNYFQVVIAILWVAAFASSTHDICGDGVYITSLNDKQQATWIGWQGAAWNAGRVLAQGVLVTIAGQLKDHYGDARTAWMIAFGASAVIMVGFGIYHRAMLPTGTIAHRPSRASEVVTEFRESVADFFRKPKIWPMLLLVFLYRSGEGFLLVEAPLFVQAPLSAGGLGLTLAQKGLIDGTLSTAITLVAGVLGGMFISKYGLKKTLFFMALCVNIPHVCFVYLSHAVAPDAPLSIWTVLTFVTIEKFGYSFGMVANMLYMMQQISPGRFQMAHYAFCTALMNLVLVPAQAASGPIADALGYKNFFVFVLLASIPSLIVAFFAPFPLGEKEEEGASVGTPKPIRAH
jgi:MFS transporter, PAT family, beta-lactamase induction signal transducer AmpG